jgi:hypothetical protein
MNVMTSYSTSEQILNAYIPLIFNGWIFEGFIDYDEQNNVSHAKIKYWREINNIFDPDETHVNMYEGNTLNIVLDANNKLGYHFGSIYDYSQITWWGERRANINSHFDIIGWFLSEKIRLESTLI